MYSCSSNVVGQHEALKCVLGIIGVCTGEQSANPHVSSISMIYWHCESVKRRFGRSLAISMQVSTLSCSLCGLQGHIVDFCHRFNAAKTQAIQDVKQKQKEQEHKNGRKRAGKANTAQESTPTTSGSSAQTEFAGKASSAIPSPCYLPHNASDHLWTADTGATSHMMSHKHWRHSYQPLAIHVCLANKTVFFSAGVGSVVFTPVVEEELVHHIEFTRVLHVPEWGQIYSLFCNLLEIIDSTFIFYLSAWIPSKMV
jgi:hypothetical protein